jgi:hypothetical protein
MPTCVCVCVCVESCELYLITETKGQGQKTHSAAYGTGHGNKLENLVSAKFQSLVNRARKRCTLERLRVDLVDNIRRDTGR